MGIVPSRTRGKLPIAPVSITEDGTEVGMGDAVEAPPTASCEHSDCETPARPRTEAQLR